MDVLVWLRGWGFLANFGKNVSGSRLLHFLGGEKGLTSVADAACFGGPDVAFTIDGKGLAGLKRKLMRLKTKGERKVSLFFKTISKAF